MAIFGVCSTGVGRVCGTQAVAGALREVGSHQDLYLSRSESTVNKNPEREKSAQVSRFFAISCNHLPSSTTRATEAFAKWARRATRDRKRWQRFNVQVRSLSERVPRFSGCWAGSHLKYDGIKALA